MPQYIAGEKIKKWAVVWLDDDWVTLHNLLKTKAQKQQEKSDKLTWFIIFVLLVLYVLWAIRMNSLFTFTK